MCPQINAWLPAAQWDQDSVNASNGSRGVVHSCSWQTWACGLCGSGAACELHPVHAVHGGAGVSSLDQSYHWHDQKEHQFLLQSKGCLKQSCLLVTPAEGYITVKNGIQWSNDFSIHEQQGLHMEKGVCSKT